MPRGGHLTVMFTLATLLLSCHTCQGAIKSNSSSVFAALKELLLLLWKCNWLLLKWKWYANKDIRHKRNIKGKSFVLSASGFIACPLVLESFNYLHHLYANTGRIKWRRDKSYCTVGRKGVKISEFLQKLLGLLQTIWWLASLAFTEIWVVTFCGQFSSLWGSKVSGMKVTF